MINKVNSVINEHIRPLLAQHNGDIRVVSKRATKYSSSFKKI